MIHARTFLVLALCLVVGGAAARPLMMRGGNPEPLDGSGNTPNQACGTGGVCAQYQHGQVFVTWPDVATGASGAAFRYRMYRSTTPIDAGNYASATLIASYILNNSAQLLGGNPDAGTTYTQANRQNASGMMVRLTDLGTPLTAFTGLQVYTVKTNGAGYFAIVSTNASDASPSFIGSVGPISETVALPEPIKVADSLNRAAGVSYGKILSPAGKPMVFTAHASDSAGGPAPYNLWSDYWNWFLTADKEGFQDGRQTTSSVLQDSNHLHFPSLTQEAIEVTHRDTRLKPNGADSGMEMYHIGEGLMPNLLVGPANRYYLTGCREIARILNWAALHYNTDRNAVHWRGHSMGAWGGAVCGIRGLVRVGGPTLSSLWLEYPIWRQDRRSCAVWPGSTWSGTMPFKATVAAASCTLGSNAAAVVLEDGRAWGGDGGFMDIPRFVASDPGTDLPFVGYALGKYDGFAAFGEQIEAAHAFESSHRGYAFAWAIMAHEGSDTPQRVVDCDTGAGSPDNVACYGKNLFKLNLPYVAFSNSSINDKPGSATPTASGLFDGDYTGCMNCGFKWNVTSDTPSAFNFTIDNVWMDRPPTVFPTTTLTGTIALSGSGTVAVTSTTGWQSTGTHPYALVGDDASPSTQEVVKITSATGNVIAFSSRGLFGTTQQAHNSGVAIKQLITQPTGPNTGPYATMTVDVTPRRVQNFLKANGAAVSCRIVSDGDTPTVQTEIVVNGLFTLTGVTIRSSGPSTVSCS